MAEPTRQYIFNENQIRTMFIAASVMSISVIVALLLLLSTRAQGQLTEPDRTVFLHTLHEATSTLHPSELSNDSTHNRIDIELAMELIVARGTTFPFTLTESNVVQAPSPDAGKETPPVSNSEMQPATPLPNGGVVYNNCIGCHQANGAGIPGVFPPLVDHVPLLYSSEGPGISGRTYLIHLLLFGLQGEIKAGEVTYNGIMPAWPQLSDAEIAAVLNHILSEWQHSQIFDNFIPYSEQEIGTERGLALTPQEVYSERQQLPLP